MHSKVNMILVYSPGFLAEPFTVKDTRPANAKKVLEEAARLGMLSFF